MGRVNYFLPPYYLFIQKSINLSKMGWLGSSKEFPGLGFGPKCPMGRVLMNRPIPTYKCANLNAAFNLGYIFLAM